MFNRNEVPIVVETDKEETIRYLYLFPTHLDTRFFIQQLVFQSPTNNKEVTYIDTRLLRQAHGDQYDLTWQKVEKTGLPPNSALLFEKFLQELLNDGDLELVQVLTGFDILTVKPYNVFGVIRK